MAFNNSNTAPTAAPSNLKGKSSSQTKGYIISTAIASGKEIIAKITHKINVNIFIPFLNKYNYTDVFPVN